MTPSLPKPNLSNPVHFLAFGFGAGCVPVAPGTMGTLAAVPLYLLLAQLPLALYLLAVFWVAFVGVPLCGRASRDLGVHDHGGIVWDEISGFLLAMTAVPTGWGWLLAGFVLFRLFDIWKPWPIRWADERLSGGLGIMLDDWLAGLYALACLQLAAWVMK